MNKLTKCKRHSIYTKMLKELDKRVANGRPEGFCFILWDLGYKFGRYTSLIHDLKDLPELYMFIPNYFTNTSHWFPRDEEGMNKRRDILLTCIEKTKPIHHDTLLK